MKGKAIYEPKGKAGEYAKYACNFYNGCSNGCTYCYLKKGRGKAILGGDVPTLKKCFKNEEHALQIFEKELKANLSELRKHGLFFTFTSDPMLLETIYLTTKAVSICCDNNVPVKILTKRNFIVGDITRLCKENERRLIAFGFTLTGHDELEPNASPNAERIEAMQKLNAAGFKTFCSAEPIITFSETKNMIDATKNFCDLYKVGLMSGKKYDTVEAQTFVEWLAELDSDAKIYIKESLQKLTGYNAENIIGNFVDRQFNIWEI